MTEAAKQNAIALRDAARRDVSELTGGTKSTIVYYPADGTAGLVWRVVAGLKDGKGFQARFLEFGTVDQPAQPFFFSNYRVMRQGFRARMARAWRKGQKEA